MGMLINGQWSEQDQIIFEGAYERNVSHCRSPIVAHDIIAQPGRFILIASWSCPWSHRTMLFRQLLGLSEYLGLHITGGKKVQGYSANHGKHWLIPGSDLTILHLHQLYRLNDQDYTGRATVPILWDSFRKKIISNESTHILEIMASIDASQHTAITLKLPTAQLESEMQVLNTQIYTHLSNGVYRAGFAQSQTAYESSVQEVFTMLKELNNRLANHRYLMGDILTQADWLLFPTLVRFDIDYYLHSRCTLHRLKDFVHLWDYARTLYNMPGIAATVNFAAIHQSNYHDAKIIPLMPAQNWQQTQ